MAMNRHEVEILTYINVAGRLNRDHGRVSGEFSLQCLVVKPFVCLQAALPGQLAQGITVPEEQHPVVSARVTKGSRESVVPFNGIGNGQPAGASTVSVRADLDPFLGAVLLTCIDVKGGKRHDLPVRPATGLFSDARTWNRQYPLEKTLLTHHQQRFVTAPLLTGSHCLQGQYGDNER